MISTKGGVGLIRFEFIQLHLKHLAFRELIFSCVKKWPSYALSVGI